MRLTAGLVIVAATLSLTGCSTGQDREDDKDASSNPCEAIVKARGDANLAYVASRQKLHGFSAAHPKSIRLSTGGYANSKTDAGELLYAKFVSGQKSDRDEFSKLQDRAMADGRMSVRIVTDNPDCFDPPDVAEARETLDYINSSRE